MPEVDFEQIFWQRQEVSYSPGDDAKAHHCLQYLRVPATHVTFYMHSGRHSTAKTPSRAAPGSPVQI